MRETSRLVAVMMVACLPLLGGCGGNTSEPAVSGTVQFDGAPLGYGTIHFEPETSGQANAATTIEEGRFALPTGHGLVPGSYKVSVKSGSPPVHETDPDKAMALASQPAPPEKIAPKYNTATELRAEIKTGTSTPLNFEVFSK